ncbi:MAG: ExeA family protein [Desulfuromonas sp.]|jgi:type II secretory pathway predicted ATPase ExeA|uniref:ExeA family protein n=1 Tax=Desulfuromonas thiophila TaxID=57664 RepID=UPI0024A810B7|nr:AAA family ATPase [Desulfuromonas thiophila]MCK9171905.1 AAA family ATPase [Desulfuromonas thiophila]MDD3800732.1 AAA family ATPase [Desulfuromonas thiophila]MDY0398446.1 AAA family ATPase [Desulfuromonas thiophila]
MSYLEHFGLEREAFSNAPDARFYFDSAQHGQALVRLKRVVDANKGLAVLVGGIGSGKTTLARRLLDGLDPQLYESSLLVMVHSGVTSDWLLTRIALQLGVRQPETERLALIRQLYDRLLEIDGQGRRAVVLIDEAQMLQTRPLMEEFRGLLNLEIPGKKLLNLLFFGLPELEDCLRLDEPLAQRVALRYYLRPLSEEETLAYIKHRLRVAGAASMVFSAAAVAQIYRYSTGVPRLINTLCDNSLFEAFLQHQTVVSPTLVEAVAGDLGLTPQLLAAGQQAVAQHLSKIESLLARLEQRRGS